MTYEETLHYLYTSIPVFQHSGASAYKPGLHWTIIWGIPIKPIRQSTSQGQTEKVPSAIYWQRSFIRRDIKSDFSHLPT